jgi:hypothetical protein
VQDENGNQWVTPPGEFLKEYSPMQPTESAQNEPRLKTNHIYTYGSELMLPTEAPAEDRLCWSGALQKRSKHFKAWRKRYYINVVFVVDILPRIRIA